MKQDVYKRQDVSSHQGLGSIFTISLPMAAAEMQNVEPIPVSYTHLDVYKRQPFASLAGFYTT